MSGNHLNSPIQQVWTFASSSGEKTYQTLKRQGGFISCDCKGWTLHVDSDGNRSCRHTRLVDQGRADFDCLSTKDYTATLAFDALAKASEKKVSLPKVFREKRKPRPFIPAKTKPRFVVTEMQAQPKRKICCT